MTKESTSSRAAPNRASEAAPNRVAYTEAASSRALTSVAAPYVLSVKEAANGATSVEAAMYDQGFVLPAPKTPRTAPRTPAASKRPSGLFSGPLDVSKSAAVGLKNEMSKSQVR